MMGMKVCENCGYRHSRGNCCMDIYQRLGQTKGPSVGGKVLLSFGVPLLLFIGSLILAEYLLSAFMNEGAMKTFIAFLAALVVSIVFVQLIRILTRKPISMEDNMNKKV